MKTCSKCQQLKELDEFYTNSLTEDGKYAWCAQCLSEHRQRVRKKKCAKCGKIKQRKEYRTYPRGTLHTRCIVCEDSDPLHSDYMECTKCGDVKPPSDFYASRRKTSKAVCKDCVETAYHEPGEYEKRRNNDLIKRYGITLDQYKELLIRQDNTCPICLESFRPNTYSYPVDHAHKGKNRGRVRGILHDSCNRFVMWKHDDSDQLRRAADLIDNPLTDWVVPEDMVSGRKRKKKNTRKRSAMSGERRIRRSPRRE